MNVLAGQSISGKIAPGTSIAPRLGTRTGDKVMMAMSGGVDSSVAAALLLEQGYEVVGCFMRLGSSDESLEQETCDPAKVKIGHQGCCSVGDASDARLVCAMLDIPFYVMNFRKDFGRVIDYFVSEYNAGRTPNPCVRCNDWLKFGKLATYAKSIGAKYVATGHYARLDRSSPDGRAKLLQGDDLTKDQSYVLFGMSQEQLDHMLLPIGEYEKPFVRQIAQKYGLPTFNKPDSQEICFVPDNDYAGLVKRRSPDKVLPGRVVDEQGQVIAEHKGHQHFTIGQRRGLGIARPYPLYVINKDATTNTITVGQREHLLNKGARADQTNWFIEPPKTQPLACQAKIRYNAKPVEASLLWTGEDELEVQFAEPQSAVTPGQAIVCYHHRQVIAGGWIKEAL